MFKGVSVIKTRRVHNPEVVGSDPAPATNGFELCSAETLVFLNLWNLVL